MEFGIGLRIMIPVKFDYVLCLCPVGPTLEKYSCFVGHGQASFLAAANFNSKYYVRKNLNAYFFEGILMI